MSRSTPFLASRAVSTGSAGFALTVALRSTAERTHEVDAPHRRQLGLPAGEHLVGVVRLHPALEEAGRHREPHDVAVDRVMLHGARTSSEILLADRGAQPLLHTRPSFLIGEAHGLALMRNCGAS